MSEWVSEWVSGLVGWLVHMHMHPRQTVRFVLHSPRGQVPRHKRENVVRVRWQWWVRWVCEVIGKVSVGVRLSVRCEWGYG